MALDVEFGVEELKEFGRLWLLLFVVFCSNISAKAKTFWSEAEYSVTGTSAREFAGSGLK